MSIPLFHELSDEKLAALIPELLASNITNPKHAQACQRELREMISHWTAEQLSGVRRDFAQAGDAGRLELANLACRDISRAWASHVMTATNVLGSGNLRIAREHGPTVLLSNHASYIDSPLLDALIAKQQEEVADDLVHLAGGKVYEDPFRRMAIVSYHSIRVQQSEAVRKNGAGGSHVSPRELARLSLRSIASAQQALGAGKSLLIYPEGSRTRDGNLGAFLPGIYRYLTLKGTQVVPVALEGTGHMMGVSGDEVTPRSIQVRFGAPFDVVEVGGARAALTEARARVSQLLKYAP